MNMQSITDYDIQALVDNELPENKARQVRDFIKKNKSAQQRYQQLQEQQELLQMWWQDVHQN